MPRPVPLTLSVVSAASLLVALGGAQASASERRGCGARVHAHTVTHAAPVYGAYYHGPRGYGYRGPRWDFSAAYYSSPAYVRYRPAYGYSSGPLVYRTHYVGHRRGAWRGRR